MIIHGHNLSLVIIIDHHKSAYKNIESLIDNKRLIVYFDNNHSGATLAWNYFLKEKSIPKIFQHIEDIDLWNFRLQNTREIAAALKIYKFDFFCALQHNLK